MRPSVRRAVAADFENFIIGPLPCRVRAFTGTLGNEVLAVGGMAFLPNGTIGVFLMAEPRARRFPLALHKAALAVLAEARALGIRRLVTFADPDLDAAEPWLRRLGFSPITIDQQQVWLWQQ
jgi:hypothetical protein